MVDTTSLKDYLSARELYGAGQKKEALELLAKSLGSTAPTDIMESDLEELLNGNEAALTLVIHETRNSK